MAIHLPRLIERRLSCAYNLSQLALVGNRLYVRVGVQIVCVVL
jgi:hypothetical protein